MYCRPETVGANIDLYAGQLKDVEHMRNEVQAFDKNDPSAAKKAVQNITILRVYHQIKRIIRYTEMMDKIEDKMYESIDCSLNEMDSFDERTWVKLVTLQEKLQNSMIQSHKLLEPYLDFKQLGVIEATAQADPANTFTAMIVDQESREKIRNSAQQVLAMLSVEPEKETTNEKND